MNELRKYLKSIERIPEGVSQAEIEVEKRDEFYVSRLNGKEASGGKSSLTEFFIKASGEKTGHVYTQDGDMDLYDNLMIAYENSFFSARKNTEMINKNDKSINYRYDEDLYRNEKQMSEFCCLLEQKIYDMGYNTLNLQIDLKRIIYGIGIINTNNLKSCTENIMYEAEIAATIKNRSIVAVSFEVSNECMENISYDYICNEISRKVEEDMEEIQIDSMNTPCVINSTVAANIMITAWKLFSGRNYYENRSCTRGMLNQKIFSEKLSISDNTKSSYSGYKYIIDCEGNRCIDTKLVENGTLKNLMTGLDTAYKKGTTPTGNSGRKDMISGVVQTEVTDVPKNIFIEPGGKKLDDMIKDMYEGIYINQSFDVFHSINISTGDFSIPCEGIVISKGLKKGKVKGIKIEGNILELFKSVEDVGCDMFTFAIPIIKSYAVSAPSLRLSNIKISM